MRISVHTTRLDKRLDLFTLLTLIKESGFDSYNINFSLLTKENDFLFKDNDYLKDAKKLRAHADSLGLTAGTTHAPFPTSSADPETDAFIFDMIVRSFEISAVLGATHIVVHPKQHLPYAENKEKLKKMNYDFYMSLLPYAKKYGIKIAIENVWCWHDRSKRDYVSESTCTTPEEHCEYIDMLPREYFCACLDIGHTNLLSGDTIKSIKMLGSRIETLHVHDNNGVRDEHLLPFLGTVDFPAAVKALKETGYTGDLNFENILFLEKIPTPMLKEALVLTRKSGEVIKSFFEE